MAHYRFWIAALGYMTTFAHVPPLRIFLKRVHVRFEGSTPTIFSTLRTHFAHSLFCRCIESLLTGSLPFHVPVTVRPLLHIFVATMLSLLFVPAIMDFFRIAIGSPR